MYNGNVLSYGDELVPGMQQWHAAIPIIGLPSYVFRR